MKVKSAAAARRAGFILLALAACILTPTASARTLAGGLSASVKDNQPAIEVLSNRADLISGGDALVRVDLPDRVDPATVQVSLNGADVTW
jgi:hypothetical protein